jgi:hypothetical protein
VSQSNVLPGYINKTREQCLWECDRTLLGSNPDVWHVKLEGCKLETGHLVQFVYIMRNVELGRLVSVHSH